jgi:hypothetical protein
MYNDLLSNEEAKERIAQRVREVDAYSLQKRLGMGDQGNVKWIRVFIVLVLMVVAAEFLL